LTKIFIVSTPVVINRFSRYLKYQNFILTDTDFESYFIATYVAYSEKY